MASLPSRPLLVLLCLLLAACLPELPDEGLIADLRVLAIQADPAVALFETFPLPTITLSALVVDPLDPTLESVTHRWSLDLPEDTEGLAQFDQLLPEGPYGTSITLNFNQGFARDIAWQQALLPFRYVAEQPENVREAVKFAYFLFPEEQVVDDGGPSDGLGHRGDPDGSVAPEEQQGFENYNENPRIVCITVGAEQSCNDPAPAEPRFNTSSLFSLGDVSEEDGVVLTITLEDDKRVRDLSVKLFWSAGCPGLPPRDPLAGDGGEGGPGITGATTRSPGADPDACPELADPYAGARSSSASYGDDEDLFQFAWMPPHTAPPEPIRLFVVATDEQGGQTWQELRVGELPSEEESER